VCSQVAVSASGLSLVQRSPTECDVSECDREVSIMRRPLPTEDSRTRKERQSIISRENHRNHPALLFIVAKNSFLMSQYVIL
jgi:hypothetical protein